MPKVMSKINDAGWRREMHDFVDSQFLRLRDLQTLREVVRCLGDINEAAQHLGVSRYTIYRARARNEIRVRREMARDEAAQRQVGTDLYCSM